MDTPLSVAVHKENVYVGGGKTTTMRKPVKQKPDGKERKPLAKLYGPSSGASKNVDLEPMAQGKQQIAGADLLTTKKQLVNRASKVANLNTHSVSHGNFEKGNKPLNQTLSKEEIKQCYEWAKDGIEQMGGYSWSEKDEANLFINQTLSEIMASAIGVSVSELEQPIPSDDEGCETDDPDLHNSVLISGRISSFTPEELDDLLEERPLPKLDFSLDNDNLIDDNSNPNRALENC